jgi:hypothetical protein
MRESVEDDGAVIQRLEAEIERLKKKCNMQALILRHINPERNPDTFFISGFSAQRDKNGLPERIEIVPAYGCDWAQIYTKSDRTVGPEW